MFTIIKRGKTSNIFQFKLRKLSTGLGFTGLTFSSSGLIISTRCDNEAAATNYTQAGSTTETVTTLGTWSAPTATKCRFREVDATNQPGVYELQFADARFAVASSQRMHITVSGVTDLDDFDIDVMLWDVDPSDSAAFGVTAMPAQAASIRTAAGLASANLDTQLSGINTAVSAASIRAALGMAAANLDTQLTNISAALPAALTGNAQNGGTSSSIVLQNAEARVQIGDVIYIRTGAGQYGSITVGSVVGSGGATPIAYAITGQNWQFATPSATGSSGYTIVKGGGAAPATVADVWAYASRGLSTDGITALFGAALSESYAASGAIPSAGQALMMVLQLLTNATVNGTTMTIYKRDKVTVALTLSLNSAYPAALPTSISG